MLILRPIRRRWPFLPQTRIQPEDVQQIVDSGGAFDDEHIKAIQRQSQKFREAEANLKKNLKKIEGQELRPIEESKEIREAIEVASRLSSPELLRGVKEKISYLSRNKNLSAVSSVLNEIKLVQGVIIQTATLTIAKTNDENVRQNLARSKRLFQLAIGRLEEEANQIKIRELQCQVCDIEREIQNTLYKMQLQLINESKVEEFFREIEATNHAIKKIFMRFQEEEDLLLVEMLK